MTHAPPAAILIAGPTASGKSGLAMALAERLEGVVINADSMQVYDELRVLTARPSAEDEARAPHRLYGHVPVRQAYSAARYAADAAAAIAEVRAEQRLPIVVGGTGLYFTALLEGLSPIPAIPDAVRAHWRGQGERRGGAELHRELAARDAVMAEKLAPADRQRIVRALEVLEATGRSLAEWQREAGVPVLEAARTHRIVVSPDRDVLYRRCDERFDAMMTAGALEEVERLAELRLDTALPAMRALGVAPLMDHLAGRSSREAAVARAKTETRQYAKRQLTWLKRHMISWELCSTQEIESILHQTIADIRSPS